VTSDFSKAVGKALGSARRARTLTLKEVERRSRGRFSASSVGGYERGERAISLDRFSALSALYRIPPETLLAEALASTLPRRPVALDSTRLVAVDPELARRAGELVNGVRSKREDYTTDVLALRSSDIGAMALDLKLSPADLLRRLGPAIVKERPRVTTGGLRAKSASSV